MIPVRTSLDYELPALVRLKGSDVSDYQNPERQKLAVDLVGFE